MVLVATAGLLTGAIDMAGVTSSDESDRRRSFPSGFVPFTPGSWWNTTLPWDPPLHPDGDKILRYLRAAPESGEGCLMLAGADDNRWGQPIYWSKPSDPTYNVTGVVQERPPELASLRIPEDAQPAPNNDGSVTIFDREKGYVVALTEAEFHEDADAWTASGASVTYLASNGLHVATGRSDHPRNTGTHRGNNGATMAVSWDMVESGVVPHVLKAAVGPEAANRAVFPMVGSDGGYEGDSARVPPQGLRLRIKPSVDLESMHLQPEALVIARALRRYGFYIGDSGARTAIKLENTETEGRGQLWSVQEDALCGLPFTPEYWQVVAAGYHPAS